MNAVLCLELASGLNTFPGGSDLDQDTLFGHTDGLVELDQLLSLRLRALLVEGETCVDFGGNAARDDLQDLATELDKLYAEEKGDK